MAHQHHQPAGISSAIEDYAKAIYALERRAGEAVTTNALAERLGVTPGSASGMVKRLAELGLVEHEPYRGVQLTDDGRRVALVLSKSGSPDIYVRDLDSDNVKQLTTTREASSPCWSPDGRWICFAHCSTPGWSRRLAARRPGATRCGNRYGDNHQ